MAMREGRMISHNQKMQSNQKRLNIELLCKTVKALQFVD